MFVLGSGLLALVKSLAKSDVVLVLLKEKLQILSFSLLGEGLLLEGSKHGIDFIEASLLHLLGVSVDLSVLAVACFYV